MKAVIRIIQGILITLLLLVVLMNVWLLIAQKVLGQDPPDIFGYSQLIVTSGSMEPEFSAGDVVIIKKGEQSTPGDIVTFRGDSGELVTHRIIGTTDEMYITRGDANNAPDAQLLDPADVVGVYVTFIPQVGEVMLFLRSPLGLVILAVFGFLLIELPMWISGGEGTRSGSGRGRHAKGGRHAQGRKE